MPIQVRPLINSNPMIPLVASEMATETPTINSPMTMTIAIAASAWSRASASPG